MKRKNIPLALLIAIVVGVLYASVFWIGGYDFDKRSPGVAMAYAYGLVLMVVAFVLTLNVVD